MIKLRQAPVRQGNFGYFEAAKMRRNLVQILQHRRCHRLEYSVGRGRQHAQQNPIGRFRHELVCVQAINGFAAWDRVRRAGRRRTC